jgi:hypothetical protein
VCSRLCFTGVTNMSLEQQHGARAEQRQKNWEGNGSCIYVCSAPHQPQSDESEEGGARWRSARTRDHQ